MATISSTSIPSIQTQSSNMASQGSDVASQIARISQQIIKLTQQIKEIVDTSGSAEDKQKTGRIDSTANHPTGNTTGAVAETAGRKGAGKKSSVCL